MIFFGSFLYQDKKEQAAGPLRWFTLGDATVSFDPSPPVMLSSAEASLCTFSPYSNGIPRICSE
jgi:hypothetical protein